MVSLAADGGVYKGGRPFASRRVGDRVAASQAVAEACLVQLSPRFGSRPWEWSLGVVKRQHALQRLPERAEFISANRSDICAPVAMLTQHPMQCDSITEMAGIRGLRRSCRRTSARHSTGSHKRQLEVRCR